MAETPRPAERVKHDLRATFDVVVGTSPAERFTVYTDVLTQRSGFFRAARKPEWLAGDTSRPVDLSDEDPDVFQAYLNCVYFGPKTLLEHADKFKCQMFDFQVELFVCGGFTKLNEDLLTSIFGKFGGLRSIRAKNDGCYIYYVEFEAAEHAMKALASLQSSPGQGCKFLTRTSQACRSKADAARSTIADVGNEALIRLYLLADKLQDLTTANMIMDALIRFIDETGEVPKHVPTSLAYNSTATTSPLRTLLCDCWVHRTPDSGPDRLVEAEFPKDFLQDIAKELMRIKLGTAACENCRQDQHRDQCQYHQHDDDHPRCNT